MVEEGAARQRTPASPGSKGMRAMRASISSALVHARSALPSKEVEGVALSHRAFHRQAEDGCNVMEKTAFSSCPSNTPRLIAFPAARDRGGYHAIGPDKQVRRTAYAGYDVNFIPPEGIGLDSKGGTCGRKWPPHFCALQRVSPRILVTLPSFVCQTGLIFKPRTSDLTATESTTWETGWIAGTRSA